MLLSDRCSFCDRNPCVCCDDYCSGCGFYGHCECVCSQCGVVDDPVAGCACCRECEMYVCECSVVAALPEPTRHGQLAPEQQIPLLEVR
jgi:hypothetical protein